MDRQDRINNKREQKKTKQKHVQLLHHREGKERHI